MGNSNNFEQIRNNVLEQRAQRITRFQSIFQEILKKDNLTPQRIEEITRHDLPALVHELNQGSVTSTQLVAICGLRACTIGVKTCIITDENFEFALKKAQECDQERRTSGKRNWTFKDEWNMEKFLPPLFGVPTSIKDNIEMEGTHATIGITARATKVTAEDCATIKCIKLSGQIPFIKTNLPQLAFNYDSSNPIWGRTLNPWNHNKSAGGSSGGEGAAVAARISPIGVGNDMAGSIRIPAAFNGVFGLLCSGERLPFQGQITTYTRGFTGMDTVMCVNGPLSKSVDSLALWLRTMTEESFYQGEHDPYRKLIPFDVKTYLEYSESGRKLRIGVLEGFEMIEPTPAAKRAVAETAAYLRSQGHEVIEMTIPNEQELILSLFKELLGEGNWASFEPALEGEAVVEEYSELNFMVNRNSCLLGLIHCIIAAKYPRLGKVIEACKHINTHQYLEHVGRIHEMRQDFIKYWRSNRLDFMLAPGFASEAPNHGCSKQGSLLATYTYIFNVLRIPSVSQPITLTREDELHYESDWEDPVTELIRTNLKDAAGLPVSIQILGLPFKEEQILGLSRRIEKHFRFYDKHPLP